jgi:hypothetical protein
MKKLKILAIVMVFTLFTGVLANNPAPAVKADSTAATTVRPSSPSSQNKQTSVQRPTKRTNWSKIKTLFE